MQQAARWLRIGAGIILALTLALGFVQNPALQSFVSLVFFFIGVPTLIVAVVLTIVNHRNEKRQAGD